MIASVCRRARPAALLAVLVLVSCSGSSSDTGGPATSTSATATSTTTTTTSTPVPDVFAAVPAVGASSDEVLSAADGRERSFHVYVPSTLDVSAGADPVPLLLAFHGGTGWGRQFERSSGFDGLAEANGFVVVYPDGIGIGEDEDQVRTWNGGACCGPAVTQDVDDVAFVDQLLDELEGRYPIDEDRVFAVGHSNGGILAYRLACELSDRIVAIGVQASSLEVGACEPAQAVSLLHVHGAADRNLPLAGGIGPDAASRVAFRPPREGVDRLAAADGCPAAPTEAVDATNPDLTRTRWSPCAAGTEVELVTVAGAGHAWMGAAGGTSGRSGPPYPDLDSSLELWTFLAAHPRST